ncbi:hypothetical protein SLE2022_393720 [Rubroshorea leprosula]
MAAALIKLTAVISLTLSLFLALHNPRISAFSTNVEDVEEDYILDTPVHHSRSRSRFLARIIRKGMHCNLTNNNICNGVPANNGTSLLYCCKKHCRNILRDVNNCGCCGKKCKFGERCCHGTCTDVAFNVNHCGKCNKKCLPGVRCECGSCGYA